jgi:pimeloyl-ACP methyl ester carboxylesterase
MQTRLATGREITYEDVGQGPVLVLLHAPLLTRWMWQPQLEAFRNDFRLLALDLPAQAASEGPEASISLEEMGDDIDALLSALEVRQPVVLVAISLSGNVALAFARKYASRLRGLVLADNGGGLNVSAETRMMYDRMIGFLRSAPLPAVLEMMLPRFLSPHTLAGAPDVVQKVRDVASGCSPTATARLIQALRDAPAGFEPLGRPDLPILVLVGNDDGLIPPAVAERLAATLGGAPVVRIRHAGHLCNLEKPDAFNQALRSFLQALAPA